jgi:diguanylate cyclase (GGDEF)-like protein
MVLSASREGLGVPLRTHRPLHRPYAVYRAIRRLLYLLAGAMVLCALLGIFWSLKGARERVFEDARFDVLNTARISALQIARMLDRVEIINERVMSDTALLRSLARGRTATTDRMLAAAVVRNPEITSLVVVDEQGNVLADSVPDTHRERRFTDSGLLQQALHADGFLIGNLHSDLATRGRTLPMLHALPGRRILIAAVNLAMLDTRLLDDGREWKSSQLLFREDGAVLVKRPSWMPDAKVNTLHFFRDSMRGEHSGLSEELALSGIERAVGGWTLLEGWPLGVFVAVDEREIRAAWLESSWPMIAISAIVVLICLAMLWLLLRLLRRQEEARQRITELATRDPVTGLFNRHAMLQLLEHTLQQTSARPHGLLFLDLDRFKSINDLLGHAAGDAVLVQMARRLEALLQTGETLGRLGGDEFVLFLPAKEARLRAEQVLAAFEAPFELEAGLFASSTSIGLSFFPDDATDPATLLRHADMAMYAAKARGRNGYCIYEPAFDSHSAQRLAQEKALQQALSGNELELYFQPQWRLPELQIAGAQALLRWNRPGGEVLEAGDFTGLAEDTHLIIPIGLWMLRQACREACHWPQGMTVMVNLSPLQLRQADLAEQVAAILAETGLPAKRLELEVTESSAGNDSRTLLNNLYGLKSLGVRLSIDHFGTEAQLSDLRRFDFDKLQISAALVESAAKQESDGRIVQLIVQLGHVLGLQVGARGVDSQAQLDFLLKAGVDVIQGAFRTAPLSALELQDMISQP